MCLRRGRARRHIADGFHDRIADAGIIKIVTCGFDDTDFGVAPDLGQSRRRVRRTEQVIAPLHDDSGNPAERARIPQRFVFSARRKALCQPRLVSYQHTFVS